MAKVQEIRDSFVNVLMTRGDKQIMKGQISWPALDLMKRSNFAG